MAIIAAFTGSGRVGQAVMIACRSAGDFISCESIGESAWFLVNKDGLWIIGSHVNPEQSGPSGPPSTVAPGAMVDTPADRA